MLQSRGSSRHHPKPAQLRESSVQCAKQSMMIRTLDTCFAMAERDLHTLQHYIIHNGKEMQQAKLYEKLGLQR